MTNFVIMSCNETKINKINYLCNYLYDFVITFPKTLTVVNDQKLDLTLNTMTNYFYV